VPRPLPRRGARANGSLVSKRRANGMAFFLRMASTAPRFAHASSFNGTYSSTPFVLQWPVCAGKALPWARPVPRTVRRYPTNWVNRRRSSAVSCMRRAG